MQPQCRIQKWEISNCTCENRRNVDLYRFREIAHNNIMIITELHSQCSGEAALRLKRGATARLKDNNGSMTISCASGKFWLTVEGDCRDYLLSEGENIAIVSRGIVVTEALADGELSVQEEAESLGSKRSKFGFSFGRRISLRIAQGD